MIWANSQNVYDDYYSPMNDTLFSHSVGACYYYGNKNQVEKLIYFSYDAKYFLWCYFFDIGVICLAL